MRPGTMFLMAGLLPLAASQVRAQSTSLTSVLSTSVAVLPSDTTSDNNDANFDLFGDFTMEDTDPLGLQSVTPISHAGSGLSAGWLLGGTLSATAGLASLVSGHGSAEALQLRTPSSAPGLPTAAGFVNNTAVIGGATVANTVSGGSTLTSFAPSSGKGGSVGPLSPPARVTVTPEPGSIALLGGFGLMLTAVKMRRRKR